MLDSVNLELERNELSCESVANKMIYSSLFEAFNLQRWNILRWVETLLTGDWKQMDELNHSSAPSACISFNSDIVGFLKEVQALCESYHIHVDIFHDGFCSGNLLIHGNTQYALNFHYRPDNYIGEGIIYTSVIWVEMSLEEGMQPVCGGWKKCEY